MVNPAILEFINQQRSLGVPDAKIRDALFTNGWKPDAVNEAFNPQLVVHPVTGKMIPQTAVQTDAEAPPQLIPISQLFGGTPTAPLNPDGSVVTEPTQATPVVTQEITRPPVTKPAATSPTATPTGTPTPPDSPATSTAVTSQDSTQLPTLSVPSPTPPMETPPPVVASTSLISPAIPAPPSSPPSPPNSRLGKLVLIIAAVLLVLLGVGLAAFAYYQGMPEVIVQKMFMAAPAVKTVTYSGTATVHVNLDTVQAAASSDQANPSTELGSQLLSSKTESITTINFSTTADFTNPDHFKGISSVLVSTDAIADQLQIFEGELRANDPVYFINIKQLPAELTTYVGSEFLNQWIKIDMTELAAERAAYSEEKTEQTLTPEQTEQIAQIWKDAQVLKITEKLPSEVITGSKSYHLAFALDETAFKQASLATFPILSPTQPTAEDTADFADSLDEFLAAVEFKDGEIWIDQSQFFVRKLQFQVAVTDTTTQKPLGYVDLTVELTDFNQPVVVPEPSPYKTMEELLSSMYGETMMEPGADTASGGSSEARLRGQDTGLRSDSEQLLSAIDRYRAFNGYAPWVTAGTQSNALPLTKVNTDSQWMDTSPTACPVLEKLSQTSVPGCQGTDELKTSFTARIGNPSARSLYVYNPNNIDTFVCFQPQSATFIAQANERCGDATGSGLPAEIDANVKSSICSGYGNSAAPILFCIP